ncbi:MAG: tRNA (N6-isopentenyl adenosine(37)-C2)-methylthiotransferase MiaB [Acidobacteriota bacterium]|nr:tRNA (N6-isopentenyl adenosine(37)-C2)-methylthiotransferase MiaB [Blastocatellia bacterium]MDW8240397.1 tRNA (N6-isopentenyl adenosine(37)-C2)-methylthiotransferase MiaB [Acidobacteriota bacterium]
MQVRSKKFFIETFGCQMNVVDSERAAEQLYQSGYEQCQDISAADVILFNTCSVREKASEKMYSRIHAIRRLKKEGAFVGIMGCVAQIEGKKLIERFPDVRLVVGTQAVGNLKRALGKLDGGEEFVVDVVSPNLARFDGVDVRRRLDKYVAFVTVMEGCDKFCTFCVVPFTRGRERSRSPESILSEMVRLSQQGVKEVHLIGQNVNSYGLGRRIEGKNRLSFAGLLSFLAARSDIPRIKFTTSHPRDFSSEIVEAIETWPQLCPWVHLPLQSGSDRVLAAMNRGYTCKGYLQKVAMIRQSSRRISLTSDIIVGFPGETEQDFIRTLDMIREIKFDSLYVFKYSPRPHTVAAKWPDTVSDSEKTARLQELVKVQQEVQSEVWREYLGKTLKVLVEGKSVKSENHWTGHSMCHKVVNFESSSDNLEGVEVTVKVDKVNPHSLFGTHIH